MTVALPASAAGPTLSAENELVRRAAKGERASFEELFRRHGQVAWRVAQAVAIDRDSAVAAVGNGFNRAFRASRRRQSDDGAFRPLLLGSIYKVAIEDARAQAANPRSAIRSMDANRSAEAKFAPAKGKGAKAKANADDALVEAAFRSLPERWRAALWLTEVESLTVDRLVPVLGVSAAVAAQLVSRGQRGFVGRFEQAHRPVPAHAGTALRAVAVAMPANLGEVVAQRWTAVTASPKARFTPIADWMNERAVRPLAVAACAMLGLGVIGLGVNSANTHVLTPAASGYGGAPAPNAGNGSSFLPGAGGTGGGGAQPGFSSFVGQNGGAAGATNAATGAGAAAGSTGLPVSSPTTGVPGTNNNPGSPTTTGTRATTPPTTPSSSPQPKTLLNLGVANVTQSGNATTVNVLPSSTGPALSATVGCSTGLGLTVAGHAIGCSAPKTAAKTAASTAAPANLSTTVGSVVGLVKHL